MRVILIASTGFRSGEAVKAGYVRPESDARGLSIPEEADELAEFAGRNCYQSWNRPNDGTAKNADYLKNVLLQEHFSVLEHASATFYIDGVSRSLLAELTRHRHLSFSVRSQRFVKEDGFEFVIPPALREVWTETLRTKFNGGDMMEWSVGDVIGDLVSDINEVYESLVKFLEKKGLPRKEARQAARSVLPNATETQIVVTGNMRAWREVIAKRNSPHADAEIRELAQELLKQLKREAPNTFQDMEIEVE